MESQSIYFIVCQIQKIKTHVDLKLNILKVVPDLVKKFAITETQVPRFEKITLNMGLVKQFLKKL